MSKKEINMGIVEIKEQNLEINYSELEKLQKISPSELTINMGGSVLIKPSSDSIEVTVGAHYIYTEQKLFAINVINNFIIKDLSKLLDNQTKELDKDVLSTLLEISVGNLRGIISTKTKTTKLEKYPLLLIDIKEFSNYLDIQISDE